MKKSPVLSHTLPPSLSLSLPLSATGLSVFFRHFYYLRGSSQAQQALFRVDPYNMRRSVSQVIAKKCWFLFRGVVLYCDISSTFIKVALNKSFSRVTHIPSSDAAQGGPICDITPLFSKWCGGKTRQRDTFRVGRPCPAEFQGKPDAGSRAAPATSVSSHPNYSNCDTNIDAEKGVCSIKEDSPCCLGCAVVGAVDALGFQRDGLAQELPRIDVGLAHLDLQTILIVTRRPNQFKRSKTRTPVAIAGIIP